MSRVAKSAISLPKGVDVNIDGRLVTIKGPKGSNLVELHPKVSASLGDHMLRVAPKEDGEPDAWMMAGTARAILNNALIGANTGFQRKLELVGVGYRAQAQGRKLNLSLGYSHPIDFPVPEGIDITTPSPTEIIVAGHDKQHVGQVAAVIRAFRPPEPYKGKGIRYSGEAILRKETKKKKK